MSVFEQILTETLPITWALTAVCFIASRVCYRKLLPDWLKSVGVFTLLIYGLYFIATVASNLDMMMVLVVLSLGIIALEFIIGLVSAVIILKSRRLNKGGGHLAASMIFYCCNILMLFWPIVFTGVIVSAI